MRQNSESETSKGVFAVFCIWTFVLLCRPQDLLPFLGFVRPALATGALTLLVVLLNSANLQGPPFFKERQVKYYTALVIMMIFSIPFSLYRRLSFMTVFTEYINVILFFYLFYKVVDTIPKLRRVLLISSLGVGLYSLSAIVFGRFEMGRLFFGTVFDPNDLAFLALGFLPLHLLFISRDNPLWIRLASMGNVGTGVLLILLTSSRGGLLAFVASAALLMFRKTQAVTPVMKAALAVAAIAIVLTSSINTERFMTLLTLEQDYNVQEEEGRLSIWAGGMRAMLANPLTGVGVNCFPNAIWLDRMARGAESQSWQAAHNSAVQIGTETGVIGLGLFLLLSWNVLRIFRRVKKESIPDSTLVKISEMGYVAFVGLFISAMFLSQAYSFYWAFYVAFSAVVNQLQVKEPAYVYTETT